MLESTRHRRNSRSTIQALCLVGLCAVGSELLAAYADNTGDLPALLFAVVFFGALYGAPALLAREVVRRAGWGWPSLLLLALALGIAQACLIDQSLFSEDYFGYEGWAESRQSAYIPVFSISANQAYNFIIGHVIFSFGAPIAVAEAWRPDRALRPWLGPVGIVIAVVAYVGAALLIAFDPESQNASMPQFITSAVLVIVCLSAAWLVGRAGRAKELAVPDHTSIKPLSIFAMTLVPALLLASDAFGVFGESWCGFAFNATITALVGAFVWWRARRRDWSVHHAAAVALSFLVCRGILAFTYFPLAGEVEPFAKYTHNIVMLLVVVTAGWFALRPLGKGTNEPSPTV